MTECQCCQDYEQEPPRYNWDFFQSDYFRQLIEQEQAEREAKK